jgi:hypothetical protein
MKSLKFSNQNLIALIIFLLALGLRLANLGRLPLSDNEAGLALQALSLANGDNASLLSQPGYISLTSLLFFLFGASDFLARLVPAVSGSLMTLVPQLFRRQMGGRASLLLALFLAVDPGLLAFSRTADGTTLSLTFSLLAVGFLLNGFRVLGGVCAGLTLLGGPLLWPGILSGGVAAWISRAAFAGNATTTSSREQTPGSTSTPQKPFAGRWGYFWLALALTAGIIATRFFLNPRGLNAIANSLVEYLQSWGGGVKIPAIQSLLLFIVYEPFFLVLALIGGVKAWLSHDLLDQFFIRWMALAVLLSILNPGQTFSTSACVLAPMLALAARQVDSMLRGKFAFTPQAGAQAFVTFALVVFLIMTVLSIFNGFNSPEDSRLRIIAAAGSFAILLLTTYLLGSGWGWASTAAGLRTAVMGLLALSVFSAGWNAAGLGRHPDREMWRIGRTVISKDLLTTTVADISEYNTGRRDTLDITIAGLDSPALSWALRDFRNTSTIRDVVSEDTSSIILTPADKLPPLGDRYRGQKIIWDSQPAWNLMNPQEWPAWLFFRRAPLDSTSIMIWVRSDLFPGAVFTEMPADEFS